MERKWSEDELKEVARQLSNPDGAGGVKTGQMMNKSNNGMIQRTIDVLDIQSNERVLEIGPGNGEHVKGILQKVRDVHYTGADVSETMVSEAKALNSEWIASGKVSFVLSDTDKLPFEDHSFDKIFTVNTIYFWQNPLEYAREIGRVLKLNGTFCLALANKSFMERLPFTTFGFQLYDPETARKLMEDAGFFVEDVLQEIDITVSNLGHPVEREIMILVCKKPSM